MQFTRRNHAFPWRAPGITLVELLVVIVILAILATAAIPAVEVIVRHSQANDSRKTIIASWQLALAYAQAQQQPVLWRIQPAGASSKPASHVLILDAHQETLWTSSLAITNLQVRASDVSLPQPGPVTVTLYPHGLVSKVTLSWEQGGRSESLVLPQASVDDAADPATKEVENGPL